MNARQRAAEALLSEVEVRGSVSAQRRAGFGSIILDKTGYCRATVTVGGIAHSVTIRANTAREALAQAYAFHKIK